MQGGGEIDTHHEVFGDSLINVHDIDPLTSLNKDAALGQRGKEVGSDQLVLGLRGTALVSLLAIDDDWLGLQEDVGVLQLGLDRGRRGKVDKVPGSDEDAALMRIPAAVTRWWWDREWRLVFRRKSPVNDAAILSSGRATDALGP